MAAHLVLLKTEQIGIPDPFVQIIRRRFLYGYSKENSYNSYSADPEFTSLWT
jgi:hypothetical protein